MDLYLCNTANMTGNELFVCMKCSPGCMYLCMQPINQYVSHAKFRYSISHVYGKFQSGTYMFLHCNNGKLLWTNIALLWRFSIATLVSYSGPTSRYFDGSPLQHWLVTRATWTNKMRLVGILNFWSCLFCDILLRMDMLGKLSQPNQ